MNTQESIEIVARVVLGDAEDSLAVFELPLGRHLIGRGEVAIELAEKDVSRRHAEIEISANGARIRDLGSKNGIWVGDRRIGIEDDMVELHHGDRFTVGGLTLRLDHPASQIQRILAEGGEPTITVRRLVDESDSEAETAHGPSLVFPMIALLCFIGMAIAMGTIRC